MQYVTFINALKFCHEKIRRLTPITSSNSAKSAESAVSISEFRFNPGDRHPSKRAALKGSGRLKSVRSCFPSTLPRHSSTSTSTIDKESKAPGVENFRRKTTKSEWRGPISERTVNIDRIRLTPHLKTQPARRSDP